MSQRDNKWTWNATLRQFSNKPALPAMFARLAIGLVAAGAAITPGHSLAAAPAVSAGSCPADMAFIPGGKFEMGSEGGYYDERPVRPAEVRDYCMDVTEVTVDAYKECVDRQHCEEPATGTFCNWATGKSNHPVNCVSWTQAQAYCRWKGKSLPSEVQWEYAARGGSEQRAYPWGTEHPDGRACWNVPKAGTCPVKQYAPGAYGLYDMAGNVWEWVYDWYERYPWNRPVNYVRREHGKTSTRVRRGGAWSTTQAQYLRSSDRLDLVPSAQHSPVGFRCMSAPR